MGRIADVYFQSRKAGVLEETPTGYRFTYEPSYVQGGPPIAYQLPLRGAPFDAAELFPFFDGLVSEGWLLRLQSTQQHIDEKDRFGLLLKNGRDLVGAVVVVSHGEQP
jgi:serine/threonine-protein kinase HipA